MKLVFSVFAISFLAHATTFACDAGSYPLWCRGPLSMVVTDGVSGGGTTARITLYAYKNATASGALGENLKASSCAWVERPLNNIEPGILVFGAADVTSMFTFNAVNVCASNPKCAFSMCFHYDAAKKILHAPNNFVNTNYPAYSN